MMLREPAQQVTEERRRPEEPVPERMAGRAGLTPERVLALQRSGGNRMVAGMLQRMIVRPDIGPDYVEFTEEEEATGQFPSAAGNLTSDPDHRYQKKFDQGERVFQKSP